MVRAGGRKERRASTHGHMQRGRGGGWKGKRGKGGAGAHGAQGKREKNLSMITNAQVPVHARISRSVAGERVPVHNITTHAHGKDTAHTAPVTKPMTYRPTSPTRVLVTKPPSLHAHTHTNTRMLAQYQLQAVPASARGPPAARAQTQKQNRMRSERKHRGAGVRGDAPGGGHACRWCAR